MAQYSNLEWQYPGLSDVGSYQLSAIPFVTTSVTVPALNSTPIQISFPGITKFVTVVNETTGSNVTMRVGFSALGISGSSATNYFRLDNGESYTGEWRVTSIFMMSDSATSPTATVIAGVTNIPTTELSANWSGSSGVG